MRMDNLTNTLSDDAIDDDPALWKFPMSVKDKNYLAKRGPFQLKEENFTFPIDTNGRRFTSRNYLRKLANGEVICREWLVYSKSLNSVFCFACKLFSSSNANSISLTDTYGFSDWKHLSRILSSHEISNLHISNFNSWKLLQKSLNTGQTIDAVQQKIFNSVKEHWINVLKRIISIILHLAGQNIAFRGSSEKLYTHNNGNFLKTVELLAKYDPVMKEHINKIETSSDGKRKNHYLGPQIQNELIQIISNDIKMKIISNILQSKYFSLILDCTPDKNKREQLTIILRYVKLHPLSIEESFVEFCPVINTTGEGLTEVIVAKISELGLDIKNLRGQGYDNGANMRGKNIGVQKRILDLNNRAMFVPCAAHSLNLVINDAVKKTFETIGFFSLVQSIYVFFSASTQRWSLLKEKITLLTLKPLSDTRWESRVEAIKPLKYQIGEIYDALLEIVGDLSYDATVRHEADSFAKKIKKFDFLVCINLWYDILNKINPVSKLLQRTNIDIIESTKCLESLKKHFQTCRTDDFFKQLLVDAGELAGELEIEAKFVSEFKARPRKKTRQFLYEGGDEPILNPKQKFKVEIFFVVLDTIIQSLKERFELLRVHADYFSFLYDISLLTTSNESDLLKHCMDLHTYLSDNNGLNGDINGLELKDELVSFMALIGSNQHETNTPLNSLKYITEINLENTFPNLVISLRILLTLPISVASGERSFSKLKIIENYLRSSMSQERLSGLALISIEHQLANQLNYDKVISLFAEKKARRYT